MTHTVAQTREQLRTAHCRPLEGESALPDDAVGAQLAVLPGWTSDGKRIERTYAFADYWETIAFVNAIAWVLHREDHHPELSVGYNRIVVRFDTHSVGGISTNDFICAAKTDALYADRPQARPA